MKTYDWQDIPVGAGICHYKVVFYANRRKVGIQYATSRKPLQKMVQDWMDGKKVVFKDSPL